MRILTIFGTRPEIIRLSLVLKQLDDLCESITVHTGQNFDESLSDIFFRDLKVRTPDVHLGIRSAAFGEQVGQMLAAVDKILEEKKPDRVLILGDTNSGLAAIPAARRGIPVFHMEAGNRCYDDRVPEEVNRRIIDHSSTILLPYTRRSAENLVREGIERDRIYVTGNPIFEVLENFRDEIASSSSMENIGISPKNYFLVTLHRAENVDRPERLKGFFEALEIMGREFEVPVIVSVHPRTREKLKAFNVLVDVERIKLLVPLGFFDFVSLEKNAKLVLTDSGTVQEECAIFGVPNVTLRDVTERPETLEAGSNILAGGNPETILRAARVALSGSGDWSPPDEYIQRNVSQTVANIVLGHLSLRKHRS